jgi:hypothetical protein
MWKPSPRYAQTGISCSICKKPLIVRRSCHNAYLSCEHCNKNFSIQEYIQDMDPILEEFLEGINCDRI